MTLKADEPPVSGMGTAEFTTLTREPLTMGQPEPPEMVLVGDAVRFAWPRLLVEALLTHGRDHAAGVTAELEITLGGVRVHSAALNLVSTSGREGVVKKLLQVDHGLPWRPLLETLCYEGTKAFRAGAPFICLLPRLRPEAERFLIPKLLVRRESNVIFADGGHGKSLVALALAVAATGVSVPGIAPATEPVRVLYLDWESTKEEHEDRLFKLLAGLGIREAPPIVYREMTRPLIDEASAIRAVISEHQIGLVLADSLAPASGQEPESPDAAVRTLTALRSFSQTTRLALAHVSKVSADQRTGPTRPFGSVFIQNLGRNVWEIRGAQDEDGDELRVGLYHRKVNSGRLVSHPGLRFAFAPAQILLTSLDIAQEPDLVARAPLWQRLRAALVHGPKTIPVLALELGAKDDTIDKTLRRHRAVFVRLPGDKPPYSWGLVQP
jgi:AAA domain-containing protein